MAQPPLLIIYQWALRMFALWLQHLLQVAGWLRLHPQAEPLQHGKALLLLGTSPPLI